MKTKIAYLDGLRGLAACVVVVSHFCQIFAPSVFEGKPEIAHFPFEGLAARTPLNLMFNGNFSVCVFFVLSGYVLSWRYFLTKDKMHIYASALRRFFRLAIPASLSVCLAFAVMRLGWGYFDDIRQATQSSMPDPFTASPRILVMIQEALYHTFFTYGSAYNPVLWTMTYELLGSFLIFGFLLTLGRFRLRIIGYAALAVLLADSYYLGFVLGMVLSDLTYSGRNLLTAVLPPWSAPLFLGAGLFLGSFPYVGIDNTIYSILVWKGSSAFSFFVFYHTLGAGLTLTALLISPRLKSLFGRQPFLYLGTLSFSLYLVHFTVICSLGSYLFYQFHLLFSYGLSTVLTVILTTPFIFALAHLYCRFVDAPTLAMLSPWSRRVMDRLVRKKSGRMTVEKSKSV
ncbi:peptidoglycan/LPS O-acetylase OafA/YrhL [Paenibacillus rhizosphaerae]|uniref:Peptidoglycan/LPS O-acetylase OafA/YrhL n=1 Tax=Paenibacillus rhizosphaerae TaxID=297318 RepID=A0A839U303_9BACL|nr:acyltransferase [Paenibacillus rhizosphaerae]MBB3131237.1 peptidoglycan/LPS O-acetylase OafA/YrhL [Paenibacillus rhizosphaerae]